MMTLIVPEADFLLQQVTGFLHAWKSPSRASLSSPRPPAISALIRQHPRVAWGVGDGTVCRSSGEYTDGNPRRQAKDPAVEYTEFVEQINNDASRNSGLNLSLRYATVVPYSVLHQVLATDSFLFTAGTVKGKVGRRTGPGGGLAVRSSTCPQCISYALRSGTLRLTFGDINNYCLFTCLIQTKMLSSTKLTINLMVHL